MNTNQRTKIALSLAALFAGVTGAISAPLPVLPTVGPESGSTVSPSGYLVVYTDTESPINTGDIQYYPHSGYKIYDRNGTLLRNVRNHLNERDEAPMRVSLPAGKYTVVGRSETQGEVAVPIVVGSLRTTVVNLEKRSHEG
jgi:hypothetical protein